MKKRRLGPGSATNPRHGETRNIVPKDLNHDGIMDFSFNEDPL